MIKSSVFISFISALYSIFTKSRVYAIVDRVISFMASALKGTLLFRGIAAAGKELSRDGSLFYGILKKISGSVLALSEKIYNASKSGVIYKTAKLLFGESKIFKAENFLVLGLFVIFVCPHEVWNNAFGLLFALAAAMLYIAAVVRGKNFGQNAGGLWLPFLLFGFAVLFSVVISMDRSDSVRVLMFFVTSFIICTAVYGAITNESMFDKLCGALYMAFIVTGIVAIVQKILGIEVDALLTDVSLNEGMPGRAFSTWANPNNFAEFLIIFFPFCFAFAVTRGGEKKKLLYVASLLIPFAALLLTYSRSGWIGFAVTVFTFVILYNKKMLPAIVLLILMLIPLLPSSVLDRIMTIGNLSDSSSSYRIDIWTGTAEMLKQFWYSGTGLGPGAFGKVYPVYAVPGSSEAPHTHMLFLEVFAEMGIIGLLCFAALIICLVARTCRASYKVPNGKMKLYTISAAASMTGILTIGFAEYVWFYPRVMFAFFAAIGMAMAAVKLSETEK